MDTKDALYAFGIIVTFVLGAWNFIQVHRATRKANFINTVTAQRVKWLEQIRQDVAEFVGLTHHWTRSNDESRDAEKELLREIDRLRYVIRLRLNPSDPTDIRIAELVKRIPDLTHETQSEALFDALEELTTATQQMLKAEWEKVKSESKDGDIGTHSTVGGLPDTQHPADETKRDILVHGIAPALIAIVLMTISTFVDTVDPGEHWLQRSGSIVTILGAYVAYVNATRSIKYIQGGLYLDNELPYRWISVLLVVVGTVVWGYGDKFV